MDACDVLIVGGGPAGSSCAWTYCFIYSVQKVIDPLEQLSAGL